VKARTLESEVDILSRDESMAHLLRMMDDYFANLDTLFSKEQIIQAFPKLLQEIGAFLMTHKYPKEFCSLFDSATKKLAPMVEGEIKGWKETPVENPIVARKSFLMRMKSSVASSTCETRVTTVLNIESAASISHVGKFTQMQMSTRGTKSKRSTLA
jgi:hypothetical protein